MEWSLELRDLLRLVALSLLVTWIGCYRFQRNAPSCRTFLALGGLLLLVGPALLIVSDFRLPIALQPGLQLNLDQPLPWLLVAVLALVGLCLMAREALGVAVSARRTRRCPLWQEPGLLALTCEVQETLKISGRVDYRCDWVAAAPYASTFGGAQVVLPSDFLEYDQQTQRASLVHELIHIKRRDDRWCFVLRLALRLYWFLPWLRHLEQKFLQAMENSCDDRAADFFGPGVRYLEGVVTVARKRATGNLAPQAIAVAGANLGMNSRVSAAHPLLARVLRFGQRREFADDGPQVVAYLAMAFVASLSVGAIDPVAKSQQPVLAAAIGLSGLTTILPDPNPNPNPNPDAGAAARARQPQVDITRPLPAQTTQRLLPLRAATAPQPIYPGSAIRDGVEGEVWVSYTIAHDGSTVNPKIIHSRPQGVFERPTLRAVQRMRYMDLAAAQQRTLQISRSRAPQNLRVRQHFRYRLAQTP